MPSRFPALLTTVLVAAAIWSIPACQAHETILTFDTTSEQTDIPRDNKPAPAPTMTKKSATVGLGPQYIYVETGDSRRIWHFDTKRIITLSTKNKTYKDDSLYTDIAFRAAEMTNRLVLNQVAGASGMDNVMGSQNELEELFAIEPPSISLSSVVPKYDLEKGPASIKFLRDHSLRAEFFADGDMKNDEVKRGFLHFLCYQAQIHPEVRHDILDTAKFPAKLMFEVDNLPMFRTKQVFQLEGQSESDNDGSKIPSQYKIDQTANEISDILKKANDDKSRPSKDESIDYAHKAMAAGNRLDAMLSLMEIGLSSSDELEDEVRKLNEGSENDKEFQLFVRAISLSTESRMAPEAEQLFKEIDRSKLKKGYELDIYMANCKVAEGDLEDGRELFIKALKANPYIAGAWADLGETYYSGFEMARAWDCWDVARHLAPTNQVVAKVNDIEERLRHDYPDFF